MKLYYAAPSPFARKVHVTLIETGLIDQCEMVPTIATPLQTDAGPIAQNPLGKVPVLEVNDRPSIYDSRVICRYLDDRAGGGLYPAAPEIWDTLVLEATADGILEAAVLMVYEGRVRAPDKQSEAWIATQWAKVARSLDVLEQRWMGHLNGKLDAGQIGIGCALGYLDFRHAEREWRAARPSLARWFEAFSERPSMQETVPKDP